MKALLRYEFIFFLLCKMLISTCSYLVHEGISLKMQNLHFLTMTYMCLSKFTVRSSAFERLPSTFLASPFCGGNSLYRG